MSKGCKLRVFSIFKDYPRASGLMWPEPQSYSTVNKRAGLEDIITDFLNKLLTYFLVETLQLVCRELYRWLINCRHILCTCTDLLFKTSMATIFYLSPFFTFYFNLFSIYATFFLFYFSPFIYISFQSIF